MAKPFAFCVHYHTKESCIKPKKGKRDHHPMNRNITRETGLVNLKLHHISLKKYISWWIFCHVSLYRVYSKSHDSNRPFLSCLFPVFPNKSLCEVIDINMSSAHGYKFMQIKLTGIFMRKFFHEDLFWKRGTR